MPSLGVILARLHTAWDHLDSAQGQMRSWYQPARSRAMWEKWRLASPPDSIREIAPSSAIGGNPLAQAAFTSEREPFSEQRIQFWMAKPWRWRIERLAPSGPSLEPDQVTVIDGGLWWSWSAGEAVYTNARTSRIRQARHAGVDSALLVMLDPAPLVGTLRLRVAESAEEIGRRGDVVTGVARDPQADPGLWAGADQYRLLVDRERGVLLRAEALLADEVYARTAFTELLLDVAIPDERFTFHPPDKSAVRDR